MKFSELPQGIQDCLNEKRKKREESQLNTATEILLYNTQFTRYFWAKRHSSPSQHWRFGGGNFWEVEYGEVIFCKSKVCGSFVEWDWGYGKRYSKVNGVVIPNQINNKAQVLSLVKQIGIFHI